MQRDHIRCTQECSFTSSFNKGEDGKRADVLENTVTLRDIPLHMKEISQSRGHIAAPRRTYVHTNEDILSLHHRRDISIPTRKYIHNIGEISPHQWRDISYQEIDIFTLRRYISTPRKIYLHTNKDIYLCKEGDISMPRKRYLCTK